MLGARDATREKAVGQFAQMLERYVAAFNAGDTAGYAAFYAPGVVLVNGAGEELRGPQAITAFYAALRGQVSRELVVEGTVEGADIRRGSPTFGRWAGVELDAVNRRMFWVPEGFAHGFVALEDGVAVGSVVLNRGDRFHLRSMALYEIENGRFTRIQAVSLERTVVRKGEQ